MISELYYSIKKSIYWIKDGFEVFSLVKNNYYINAIYNISDDQILDLNNKLKSINSYMGFFKLDQDNSLHIDLFYNKLIKDRFIYKNKFYYKSYHNDPKACEPLWAKSYKINYSAIDELEFDEYFPRTLEVKVISDQGKKIA